MAFHPLTSADDLADALAASHEEPIVLYKHSATCPLSARARKELQPIAEGEVPTHEVVVQQARPVSNQISHELGIRHETPQVLIVHNGAAVFDTSHGAVTTAAVQEALQAVADGGYPIA
jgi:bacillithiol system protein YtxJ